MRRFKISDQTSRPSFCLVLGLVVFAGDAFPVCRVPQPRTVCAEYINSQVVVIAKLLSIREVGDNDGHFYSLATVTSLRGQVDSSFQVWEENSSGRATFDWKKGVEYLLFTSFSKQDRAWVIDGCGNSGPLSRSSAVLAAIKSMNLSAPYGEVEGMASTDSWTTALSDVTIRAVEDGKTFSAKTGQDGRFKIQLPVGHYQMTAIRAGWLLEPVPFSYENPSDLRLTGGACAQVQFSGTQKR